MPYTFTDADNFDDPVQGPAGSDKVSASSWWRAMGQSLANRTRWLKNSIGRASGIASLDGSSRVVQLPKNAIVATKDIGPQSVFSTSSAVYAPITGTVQTVAGTSVQIVGDLLDVFFDAFLDCNITSGGGDTIYIIAQYSKDSGVTWTDIPGTEKNRGVGDGVGAGYDSSRARIALGAPTAGQTLQVRLQARNVGNTITVHVTVNSLVCTLVRP